METRMTMVDGEILYLDGQFTRFSYPDLLAEIREIQKDVRAMHSGLQGRP
jgi:5-methylthioadenosine/S-adenosylhomocysteine deaminase